MFWHQPEQIDDVDKAQLNVREVLPQHRGGGQGLHGSNVPAAGHHKIRFAVLIAACPRPYSRTLCAVLERVIHAEILKMRLLVGDDHIDVVAAP